MIKVDVISGFLGAGKTTLIKKLLSEAISKENVVLIENEFGEIGIDGGFLKDSGINIKEMNSGCICCTLVGDFATSLKEVVSKYHPERIIIEPSGVGKLSDVANAVINVNDKELVVNSLTTVVDAQKCKMYKKNFGEFFDDQIEHANTVILSRADKASEDCMREAMSILSSMTEATFITTPINELSGEKILSVMENKGSLMEDLLNEIKEEHHHHHDEDDDDEECCCGHHHHDDDDDDEECCCGHHHHDEDDDDEECSCGHHHHDEHDHHHHEGECCCGQHDEEHEHHHHHHADEVFTSFGVETAKSFTREELNSILSELANSGKYGTVLRAKGMLKETNSPDWLYFDLVPEEFEIRKGNPEYTGRLCIIGSKLDEKGLKNLLGILGE